MRLYERLRENRISKILVACCNRLRDVSYGGLFMPSLFASAAASQRTTYFYCAAGSLLLGSAIYILFRSESLLMFRWANLLGLFPLIHSLRLYSLEVKPVIPAWVVYSLPFALWTVSYMLFIQAIWFGHKSIYRVIWFWAVPVISLASELGQYRRFVPGTFDIFDLLTIAFAVALVLTIIAFGRTEPREKQAL
jgi:hypothetical protein